MTGKSYKRNIETKHIPCKEEMWRKNGDSNNQKYKNYLEKCCKILHSKKAGRVGKGPVPPAEGWREKVNLPSYGFTHRGGIAIPWKDPM